MRGGIRSDIYALHGYNKRREPASATSATDGQFLYYTTRSPPGFHHQRQPLCRLFCFTAAVVLVVAALISLYLVKRYSNSVGKAPATCSGYPSWLSAIASSSSLLHLQRPTTRLRSFRQASFRECLFTSSRGNSRRKNPPKADWDTVFALTGTGVGICVNCCSSP